MRLTRRPVLLASSLTGAASARRRGHAAAIGRGMGHRPRCRITAPDGARRRRSARGYSFKPGLHMRVDARRDHRIVITSGQAGVTREGEMERARPDAAARERAEDRRWKPMADRRALPIRAIDPRGDAE